MNRISTLFVFACSFVLGSKASAQVAFDTQTEVAALAFNCWTFTNVAFSGAAPITGSGSLLAQESAGSTITTAPYEIPANNLVISFNYTALAAPNGNNTIKVLLEDLSGTRTILETISFNKATGVVSFTGTYPIDKPNQAKNINGTKRIVLEVVNSVVQIDDFYTNAPVSTIPCMAQSPMPVKLMNFQGSVAGNKAQLKWAVADNETGNYFQVLRSVDGKTFAESATLFANSKVGAESYSFADGRELDAVSYYKLKIVNKDGSVSYSGIIALKSAATGAGNTLTILKNPVEATLNFSYTSATATQSNVTIYSTAGVKVYGSRINSQKGMNTVSLNLDKHLAAGTYVLEVVNSSGRSVARLVKN